MIEGCHDFTVVGAPIRVSTTGLLVVQTFDGMLGSAIFAKCTGSIDAFAMYRQ